MGRGDRVALLLDNEAAIDFHIGYASAVAYLTTIAMVLIIVVYLWILRSEPAT